MTVGRALMTRNEYLRRPEAQGHLKVLEVLRCWDPIGVISEDNQDEYDAYAAGIVRLLDTGASARKVAKHMKRIVSEYMGIGVDKAHTRSCAKELVAFWREWKFGDA